MKAKYVELYRMAEAARERSYSPYSGISVGAALLTEDGEIYTGANIENAAFGPTVCAERVALFTAYHKGERHFRAIAIAGGKAGEASSLDFVPCGTCRQVMLELTSPELLVITGGEGDINLRTLGELLPTAFDKKKI